MKERNRIQQSQRARGGRQNASPAAETPELSAGAIVAHMTIPAFMWRVSQHWDVSDHNRFGDLVVRTAEACGMSYLTTFDENFGTLRVFPLPFLQRIYRICAERFPGWPKLVETPKLGEGAADRETLVAHERVATHLNVLKTAASDMAVQSAIDVVLELIRTDCDRLRGGMPAEPLPASATA